ncbi:MAG: hypothetical protein H7249_17495 [Chitinophagaceae bacterium]|nr:hypothetical protein [Oligoflexus sp.]
MGASGLGSLLVKEGFLTEQDRLTITKTCGQGSWAFAKSILAIGLLDEDELAGFFAERTRYQIAPKDFLTHLDQSAVHSVDRRLVSKLEVIPLKKDPGKITVGVVDPLDRSTLKQLEFFTGLEVNPVVIPLSQLYEGLARIDPDFRLQPTALTHFLQNHAQSAWVRQKLESSEDRAPTPSRARHAHVEEIYDSIPEIEEVEDDELDAEVVEEEFEVEDDADFKSLENDFAMDNKAGMQSSNGAEVDPFAGDLSELDGFDVKSLLDTGSIDDEFGMSTPAAKEESEDLLELVTDDMDLDVDTDLFAAKVSNPKNEPFDFDVSLAVLEEENEKALENKSESNDDDELDLAAMDTEELESEISFDGDIDTLTIPDPIVHDDLATVQALSVPELDDQGDDKVFGGPDDAVNIGALESEFDAERTASLMASLAVSQDDEPLFEMDDMPPAKATHDEPPPMSSFGFEETKPRAMPRLQPKIEEALHEPSFELDKAADRGMDKDLLADLHFDSDEDEIPISQYGGPTTLPPITHEPRPIPRPVLRAAGKAPSFADEEDTQIDLFAAKPEVNGTSDDDDDDDIELHPKPKRRERSNSGHNPTSALNEIMLRLSLCFGPDSVFHLLSSHLGSIGTAGCLVNIDNHRQILWSGGAVLEQELGPAALHPMLKSLENIKWKTMELRASESWTGKALKLRIYRKGDWLWAHSLNAAEDTPIFRDTVESIVSQVADKTR